MERKHKPVPLLMSESIKTQTAHRKTDGPQKDKPTDKFPDVCEPGEKV